MGLASAQCPVFSLSMQIYLLSDSLFLSTKSFLSFNPIPYGVNLLFSQYWLTLPYPIVTFAYGKVKKYPIRSSITHTMF